MRRLVVLFILLAACGGTSAPTTTSISSVAPDQSIVVPAQLEDLEVITLDVGGRSLIVAVADTTAERRSGLMFITELDDLDGMVFVYGDDTATTFHMENTLIPLDIAWFAADGAFVSKTTMTPCETDDCPSYSAAARYRYAIEVPAGDFDWVDSSVVLDVTPLAN